MLCCAVHIKVVVLLNALPEAHVLELTDHYEVFPICDKVFECYPYA